MNATKELSNQLTRDLMDLEVDAINYEDLANRIVRMFADTLQADICTLWRRVTENGSDQLMLGASKGFERKPGEDISPYILNWAARSNEEIDGVTAWIAIRNEPCLSNSYQDLAENRANPWFGAHRGKWDNLQFMGGKPEQSFKSLLGLPIVHDATKSLVAVIKVENSRKPGGFDDHDFRIATLLVPFAAIALQSMTKREEREQERQRVLEDLVSTLPHLALTAYHQQVVDKTAQLLNADSCSLWLVQDRTKLVLSANYGIHKKTEVPEYPLNWDAKDDKEIEGLTPWVAIRKKAFFATKFEDLKNHKAHRGKWDKDQWDAKPAEKFGALYAVPLVLGDDTIGVLKIENSRGKHVFNNVDKATFDVMADFISLAIELTTRLRSSIPFYLLHQLNQPTIGAVDAFNQLREELARDEPRQRRITDRLEMLAINLDSVRVWTKNVYGLAAPGKKGIYDLPSDLSLRELLTETISEIQKLFPNFKCDLPDDLVDASINLSSLEQKKFEVILFNILENSYKYSDEPRIIRAEAELEDQDIVVTISDNGQGIPPEILPSIFEPFFSTSKPRSKWSASLGLGLSTVKNLLLDLGWSCKVQSKPGEGTRFSIIIPRSKKAEKNYAHNQ